MRIYFAALYDAKDRIKSLRDEIEKFGHSSVSMWLDAPAVPHADKNPGFLSYAAIGDLADIRDAEILILDTFNDNLRGGREVEFGYALSRGIPTIVVGPIRNVFHNLAWKHFDNWETAKGFLASLTFERKQHA